jgi:hypothetical protein
MCGVSQLRTSDLLVIERLTRAGYLPSRVSFSRTPSIAGMPKILQFTILGAASLCAAASVGCYFLLSAGELVAEPFSGGALVGKPHALARDLGAQTLTDPEPVAREEYSEPPAHAHSGVFQAPTAPHIQQTVPPEQRREGMVANEATDLAEAVETSFSRSSAPSYSAPRVRRSVPFVRAPNPLVLPTSMQAVDGDRLNLADTQMVAIVQERQRFSQAVSGPEGEYGLPSRARRPAGRNDDSGRDWPEKQRISDEILRSKIGNAAADRLQIEAAQAANR